MPSSSHTTPSRDAQDQFAALAARLEAGESVDVERWISERGELAPELRVLLEHWRRLDRLLGSIRGDSSVLDSTAREAIALLDPPDDATRADLERLASPARARERYQVRERLGAGGMGEVLRVHDRDLDRELAMKVVRARSSSGRLLQRFLFEARLTARLDHPGIVPVHDVGVDAEGRLWFTMPLVRGLTFGEALERARAGRDGWTRSRALESLLKVCDTLAFAHANGVVHRDLKPANVMVGPFGESYVVDWGLALVAGAHASEREGEIVGTPAYMAPEQALGRSDLVGPRADVYSVGAILYELLAGRRPYHGRSPDAGAAQGEDDLAVVRAGPPQPVESAAPDAPAELVAICEKAMARDLEARYAGVGELATDLRAWMDGRVVRAHEQGAWPELRKWVARNRSLSLAVAASVVLAIGGLATVSWVQAAGKAEVLRLADVRRLADLESRAEDLWPAVPEKASAMELWLVDARALSDHLVVHERTLREMGDGELPGAEERWRRDVLTALIGRLRALGDPDPSTGTIASVRARLEVARTIRARSLEDHAADWSAAIVAIADERASPAYAGLAIAPQLGLVPLGRDPRSGLFEFAHLASGAPARRTAEGTLAIDPDTGIVLVLVPGGTFTMGSQAPVPGRASDARTDPLARENELPARTLRVAPFLVSKYEMTHAQWQRAQGMRASDGASGKDVLPAAMLSWAEADRATRRLGLALPTEEQWEYAARAFTATRWWVGNDPRGLLGTANGGGGVDTSLPYDDGWPDLAPVNALAANPWGLHHVYGNVGEWTADDYDAGAGHTLKAVRGGSFKSSARELRSASRSGVPAENRSPEIGLRPVRALDR